MHSCRLSSIVGSWRWENSCYKMSDVGTNLDCYLLYSLESLHLFLFLFQELYYWRLSRFGQRILVSRITCRCTHLKITSKKRDERVLIFIDIVLSNGDSLVTYCVLLDGWAFNFSYKYLCMLSLFYFFGSLPPVPQLYERYEVSRMAKHGLHIISF